VGGGGRGGGGNGGGGGEDQRLPPRKRGREGKATRLTYNLLNIKAKKMGCIMTYTRRNHGACPREN